MSITDMPADAQRGQGTATPRPGGTDDATAPGATDALLGDGYTLSRTEVLQEALRYAAFLSDRGVRPGDRVILKGQNSPQYVLCLLALMHLDSSIVLLDDGQTPAEVDRAVAVAKATWLVVEFEHPLQEPVGVIRLADAVDAPPTVIGDRLEIDAWLQRSDAVISWSSGTTGQPKAVVRSGPAVADVLRRTQDRMGYRSDDILLPLVPFSHFYGMTLVMLWWHSGCGMVIASRGQIGQALRIGCRAGATVVDATPSTYYTILRLLQRRPEMQEQLSQVRLWCVGGAPLSASLATSFEDLVGRPLLNGYGSSEAGNVAMANHPWTEGCGQVLEGVSVRVVDEAGEDVEEGVVGHILVSSDSLMEGYLAADGTLQPLDREVMFTTSDLGYWMPGGCLAVVGREYAVHRMGHTLYPDVLERRAEECGVPVKVVALEDERRGSALVFVVEADPGRDQLQWRRVFSDLLATYEQPNAVVAVPSFPLLANGKVDALVLREVAARALPTWNDRIIADEPTPADRMLAERLVALERVADFLEEHREEVIGVLTEISVRAAVELEIDAAVETLRGAREEIEENRPVPVQQLAVFMSSNVLLYGYALNLLVPALYCEQVVFRPSGQVGRQTRLLHEMLQPVHGLPVRLSPLSQRKFMNGPVSESNVVVFTGTYANAEEVRRQLSPDQLFLFFGQGVNPFIVTDNADLDLAARDVIRIRMLNSGQDCFGPDVILVPQEHRDAFVHRLEALVGALSFGENGDPSADYGALVYESAVEAAAEYLRASSDRITAGGSIDFTTWHVQPTIVVRGADEPLQVSEVFSPIFNVAVYQTPDQLRDILTSAYFADRSMGAMVYGDQPSLVEMLSKRHMVTRNQTLIDVDAGNEPFGGSGIMANYAAIGKKRVAEPLLISKAVADHLEWQR